MIPRAWIFGGVLAACLACFWQGYLFGRDATLARQAADLRTAQEEVRQRERELLRAVDRVSEEAFDREQDVARDSADADAAVDRLRAEIARRDAAARAAAAADSGDAATARALLAQCADKHRQLARDADRVRSNLLTLQAYVRDICQP